MKNTRRSRRVTRFLRKLWTDWTATDASWCNFEGFMMDFKEEDYTPFTDRDMFLFPVLKGTKYAGCNSLSVEEAKVLGELSQLPDYFNDYEQKLDHVLNILSKDLFTEHSLFLLKEHCKLFSPYSRKAKKLLKKLEELECSI